MHNTELLLGISHDCSSKFCIWRILPHLLKWSRDNEEDISAAKGQYLNFDTCVLEHRKCYVLYVVTQEFKLSTQNYWEHLLSFILPFFFHGIEKGRSQTRNKLLNTIQTQI